MFEEPKGEEWAGVRTYSRVKTAYERFMEQEAIPVFRGIGARDLRELPLEPWKRMGGRGTFLQLDGTDGLSGLYLAEVPPRGALNPERHLYEELYLVIQGSGATEVWKEGSKRKQIFEWQTGSLFSPPANSWHRLFNMTSESALILGATTAPHLINIFQNYRFIFENPFAFDDRYGEEDDYFKPRDTIEAAVDSKRAEVRTNFIPDVSRCYIPLDNQRSPGYRRLAPRMGGNMTWGGFLAEYPSGRYSKAHAHASGAVLVCLGGRGYTYTWPARLGTQPWATGNADLVKRQDYIPGGLVSAAPGGGEWFHQHFGVGRDPLRVLALITRGLRPDSGSGGDEIVSRNLNLQEGGRSIGYHDEDPHIRQEYESELAKEGIPFQMPTSAYA
jgi:mannose-6-phosphate isomerase-like protein (cupin superfamily)